MIIYNVTVSIHPEIEIQALDWFKKIHIPEVMETGLFTEFNMFKVIESPVDKTHNSYAFQYHLESWGKFEEYSEVHAPSLKKKTEEKFGENVLAFRTFLEKI
jgi:hypothetical protein